MQRIAGGVASRADHPRPDPALPATNDRHRPLAQNDLDLGPGRLDDETGAGPGDPREEGVGRGIPLQRDRPEPRDGFHGQARGVAGEASIWVRGFA
jgi:hypothetical protein